MGPQQSPNNKELILIALTEGGSMPSGKIREWLPANNYRALTSKGVGGAIDPLLKEGKVTASASVPRGRGHRGRQGRLYSVATGNELRGTDFTDLKTPKPFESAFEALIPCYGMNWHRDQVWWDHKPNLLGKVDDDSGANVNFANQVGVYVLYEWPNVTYVGKTEDGLYRRLHKHTTNEKRLRWDRFAWFGLKSVGANQVLVSPRRALGVGQAITAMETLLITVLSPPLNDRQGDLLGTRYYQVPDEEVEARSDRRLADQIMKLLTKK